MSLHRPTPRMEPDPKLLAFVNERSDVPAAVRERAAFFVFFSQTIYPKLEEQRAALGVGRRNGDAASFQLPITSSVFLPNGSCASDPASPPCLSASLRYRTAQRSRVNS